MDDVENRLFIWNLKCFVFFKCVSEGFLDFCFIFCEYRSWCWFSKDKFRVVRGVKVSFYYFFFGDGSKFIE